MSDQIISYSTGVDKLESRRRKKIIGRIIRKIVISSTIAPFVETHCKLWTGRLSKYGYGRMKTLWIVRGLRRPPDRPVHRIVYEILIGPAGDLNVLHKCDRTRCVNPDHLFLGTQADNVADKVRKGRQHRGAAWYTDAAVRASRRIQGEGNPQAKIKELDVLRMHELYKGGAKIKQIAEFFKLPYSHARRILRGERWGHILKLLEQKDANLKPTEL